ncbi:MAG: DUF6134 family protein [Rhodospirillaceae bacterium]|nr:DUF6134 family protein [Rhodospirillaceae bacterium]
MAVLAAAGCSSARLAWADGEAASAGAADLAASTVQQVAPPPPDQIPEIDPLALYGDELVFDIYRKKSKIGQHRVNFERDGERLTVSVEMRLGVDFMFFRAYEFEYDATEIWQGRELIASTSYVDDNGKKVTVSARADGDVFKIDGPRGATLASSWVFPTNHWHRGQVNSRIILNTINGRLTRVEPVAKGIDRVATLQGDVDAEHFLYTGELRDTEVWYDAAGRWVKMAFKAKDGSTIEYRCRQCGLASQQGQAVAESIEPQPTSSP